MSELLNCPFCGDEPMEHRIDPHKHFLTQMPDYPGSWSIECIKCEFHIFDHDSRENAVTKWNRRANVSAAGGAETVANVDALVNRFLGWRLPHNFAPDHFIKFDREAALRLHDSTNGTAWPIGTNLLDADQAREMFTFLLASMGKPVAWGIKSPLSSEIGEVLLGAYPEDVFADHIVPLYTLPVSAQPPAAPSSVAGMPSEPTIEFLRRVAVLSRIWPEDDEENCPDQMLAPVRNYYKAIVRAIGGA